MTWRPLDLVVLALATWRVTHFIVSEDGPFDFMSRIRTRLANVGVGRLLSCAKCLSLWIAVPFTFLVEGTWVSRAVLWLALSTASILIEFAVMRERIELEDR
jgi:hypothetical protein